MKFFLLPWAGGGENLGLGHCLPEGYFNCGPLLGSGNMVPLRAASGCKWARTCLGAVYGGVGHCMDVNLSPSARTQHISEQIPDAGSVGTKSRLHLHFGALAAK
jgi:hypothetical protein